MPPFKVTKCKKKLLNTRYMPYHILTGKREYKPLAQIAYKKSHGWFDDDSYHYPLLDHAHLWTISYDSKKVDVMVAYGYGNETSEKQLADLRRFFTDKGKQGHLHAIHTLSKEVPCGNGLYSDRMIKLMMSTDSLDKDTWNTIAAFSFDDRYDLLQFRDDGWKCVRPSNYVPHFKTHGKIQA